MKRQFGRYVIADEVADELGRGAFGRVYRAFDPNVNRYVAVKVLSSESDPDMHSRFRDESNTLSKLEHENIVKIHDFAFQDGMPYLVMELLEGETLERIIRSRSVFGRPIQLLDEVEIMIQVAAGLQYAHARNVIHRDIKPGNIMVLPNGTAKVMDFGIARMMDKSGTRRTRQGDIAGTILYMAPEQFKGCDADKRTDIFSYAALYYELLTGGHPFSGTDPGTVMYRITAYDPRPIREGLPECPAALEVMIQRLMLKDREIRPDNLEEVIFDTQPILQRLRQERAEVLADAIPALIEAGDPQRAQEAIHQVLKLDPLNRVARQLREQLLEEDRRRTIRSRTQTLVREGEGHVAARRFSEAVQCFESACALDKSDASLRGRLDEVKLHIEKVRNFARLLSEARTELQQGRLELALEKSEQALDLDRENQEAEQFVNAVRRQIVRQRDAAALASAEEHRGRGEYEAALALLDKVADSSDAKNDAMILRARVECDRAEAEQRRRHELFEAALSDARESIVSHRLDEAIASAEALCDEYPEEPAAPELLSEVREHLAARARMEAVGKITQAARGFLKEERFADARSVVDQGLHSYPGESSLTRLLHVAAALAAAQERASQITRIVEQSHSLAAERRVDEALFVIDRAIAEFGNEIAFVELKRDLELARARAEYAAGLQKTLEDARRLLTEEQTGEAAALLEEAKFRFPGELDLAALLSAARAARAAEEERDFVAQTLSQVAALEIVKQFGAAMLQVETALAQYPANAELLSAAERLGQKLQEQGRRRMLASRISRIETAIQSGDWERAAVECQDAARVFPAEEALAPFPARIQDGQRQAEIQLLQRHVAASLQRQDLDDVERRLAAARESFAQESVWQDLWREYQSRNQYRENLALAESARIRQDYALAEEILGRLLAGAPDESAVHRLGEVVAEHRAFEEEARREEEDRRRRERDEARREREKAARAKRRTDATELVRKGDYQAAIALLNQLAGLYPADAEIQQDRESAVREWERQQREAEEQTRCRREQAIAAQRQEAAELLNNGDCQAAIALLDRLGAEHPDSIDIRQDRETAVREWERQQREAEDQAIAERRQGAAELLRNGDPQAAIALLDQLGEEYPDSIDIRQDRETAVRAWEQQQREAREQARRGREQTIASRRQEAAELLQNGNPQGAIAILDRLGAEYPDVIAIQRDRKAALRKWERQQREAKEQVRLGREQTIATRRQEAAELLRNGDSQAAIAILDQVGADYPEVIEIRQDREAAVREWERQQREAEEQAIADRRQEAAEFLKNGDCQAAIALLDRLGAEYPDSIDIRQDREVAAREWERQQREAEERAVAARRQEAAELLEKGNPQGAIALLDRLGAEYPDSIDIRQDRETAVREWVRQQREAEEQAIAARRQEAADLLKRGDPQAAIAILDQLGTEYPDVIAIRRDRKVAVREWERQQREAEEQAIAAQRQEAAEFLKNGDCQAAIALLDRLGAEYPDVIAIRRDLKAAVRERERQQREAEEQAIAARRQEAAELLNNSNYPAAIALLDRLVAEYPDVIAIRRDRQTAVREGERRRREAEEQARRERDRAAIAEGRTKAAVLVRQGRHQTAVALLDQLATQYPDDPEIRIDREAAWRAWQQQRSEVEEQARREREVAAVAKGRSEAAGLMQSDDVQAALALLDRLALQFPDNPDIELDRKAATDALKRRHEEAEERARRALAAFSVRRSEPVTPSPRRQEDASTTEAGDAAEPILQDHGSEGEQLDRQRPDADQRAKEALAAYSARRRTGAGPGNGEAPTEASTSAPPAAGIVPEHQVSGELQPHSPGGESVPEPVPGSALSRVYGFAGHSILTARNAIARFSGKGDLDVAVPILDRLAAVALDWIAKRQPGNVALQTARDELMRQLGGPPAPPAS
jgi:serine/threonine-protein kinase